MAGKRLLDIVAILNVSREVAKKNLGLRRRELELYSKTSSLSKALRSQSKRITDTIKAASFFANRLNESNIPKNPCKTSETPVENLKISQSIQGLRSSTSNSESFIPDEVKNPTERKSYESSILSSLSEEQLKRPSIDDHGYENFKFDQILGRVQDDEKSVIKESLRSRNGNGEFLHDKENQSLPVIQSISEEHQIPEEVNTNLFHSPRVARLLGGNTQKKTPAGSGLINRPIDQTKTQTLSEEDVRFNPKTSNMPLGNVLKSDLSSASNPELPKAEVDSNPTNSKLRESRVPASRVARIWNYSGLAAGMLGGMVGEGFRRVVRGGSDGGSYMLNANNMNRLVTKLSRMRGAALKLGQMISFQDSSMLPTPVQEVLQRVQDRADYMPSYQRDKVLADNLGSDWRQIFSSFEEIPLAAASIGQVHRAVLKSNGARVAVKVQYPGVADSIDSDLKNLEILLTASRLLPKGLFLDKTISNARVELAWECDYLREAECARRFEQYLSDEYETFVVPKVYSEASGKQILTTEFMNGTAITQIKNLTQENKDWIGTQILRLCLREIIEFRFMQTDPNWTNFLYNQDTKRLELIDFGASREYSQEFIGKYTKLLAAASCSDKESLERLSIDLGYLTGFEPKSMLDAHIASVITLAEPFLNTSPDLYDFRNQTITDRIRRLIPVMIRERLSPPPEETYSLHRKLSGAFLLCARLGSRVPCRKLFEESFGKAKLI
ncbi:Atypical kinase COQ8, mitochondrial [Erysiphe neolycopersici]|uniref:Atypical kinase COQ8, mitochondrial n=1 Tax=Erysiphe neolycopersici TaxID=212602 RepID=A0A420HPL7_9PEZI|nr:Atypical kinase COQ8, mitochondrial [Erysiphe neolycopersici]